MGGKKWEKVGSGEGKICSEGIHSDHKTQKGG
jgi:hypothetical protein